MKKIIKLILIVFILTPSIVLACPHMDSNNTKHFQFYNDDYTRMEMMYPKEYFLYSKVVPLDMNNPMLYENDIIEETYGFAVVQDIEAFIGNYWFTDEKYQNTPADQLDIKPTIEGLTNIEVVSDDYKLDIGLLNTYNKGNDVKEESTYQLYYNILVKKLETKNYKDDISKHNLNILTNNIYNINTSFLNTSKDGVIYKSNDIKIDTLYDDIKVKLKVEEKLENVVAINMDLPINEVNYIAPTYNDGYYEFDINTPGNYTLVESTNIIQEENIIEPITPPTTPSNSNKDNTSIYIIIGLVVAIIIVSTLIIINSKKK